MQRNHEFVNYLGENTFKLFLESLPEVGYVIATLPPLALDLTFKCPVKFAAARQLKKMDMAESCYSCRLV